MMRKHLLLLFLLSLLAFPSVQADEGMWIPALLETLNESDMKSKGLKISAEDIYSVNQSSLKDAIVKFGGGCTGEIISAEGLLLTNHHCGLGRIQSHSSVENDYITNGFWAMKREDELPNPGLTVTFIVRIEAVTDRILKDLAPDMDPNAREAEINKRGDAIIAETIKDTHYDAEIKPFYYGNEYYMIVKEIFRDVRLVGAPHASIGKYGGDTDNWVWPRHTGDFSMFRVYTGPDGKPADYAEENIPLKPKHFFPISLKGVEENDFTMVFGFPARTQEYLTSYAVDMIQNLEQPTRVKLRDERLDVMAQEMAKSDKVRIQYTSKQAGVANGWKKWKGSIRGLKRDNAIAKKRAYEAEFTKRINEKPEWTEAYGGLLAQFEELYQNIRPVMKTRIYFEEAGYSLEAVRVAYRVNQALGELGENPTQEQMDEQVEKLRKYGKNFFKNYSAAIDEEITARMLKATSEALPADQQPQTVMRIVKERYQGDFAAFAKDLFANSHFTDESRFNAWLDNFSIQMAVADPAYALMSDVFNVYFNNQPQFVAMNEQIDELNRIYMKAQREVFAEKTFYPDANFTLRLTYGKAEGMKPNDGVRYKFYTTLDGVVAKYKPGDSEFDLPKKLLDLHAAKDYGKYGKDGELRVCFIASNHTSGGNSGSPLLNGDGHLVGLNFDRNWEGTMSDVNYDVNQCRNISVDIRYVLFIIDKLAGASHLIDEMKLIDES